MTIFPNDLLNDSLDDLIGSPARTTPIAHPPAYKAPEFVENCRKCGGTGRFGNYGSCFACKGKGRLTFKSSYADRAKARDQAATRKLSKEAQQIEDFKSAHPAVFAWIQENPTFDFAKAMFDALRKWGSLTANQLAACERCVAKREASRVAAVERRTNAQEITVDKIVAAFAAARSNGIKRPKLRLGDFTFSRAPDTGKNAGSIYVTVGEQYLGKVTDGRFIPTRECSDEQRMQVIEIAADPAASAKAYGMRTGSCSCCGRELTNGVSIDLGIGPICAEKYGW